ncbi:UreD-domain-containing protein [Fistulina hepatica ATCC 64428]|uniref:UreD-domain-containing protein n=1 Tax=Fistulina hepatica ATCC 64428 TaxID=1128425 RepID=A0A0D7A744_9AGAR|nr:UreD-domain-containing protein [Fistulina hepatica ATCC 64428]
MARLEAGVGRLAVSTWSGKAVFSELAAAYPLKLLSPRTPTSNVAIVYLVTYGGGLVGGDRISLTADVAKDAILVILSQGSTKVFKTRTFAMGSMGRTTPVTVQDLTVRVQTDGVLCLLPDPVTCFQDASYRQTQSFHLSRGASAIVLDWVTSGRKSRGEDWAFERYHSTNEITVDAKRIAMDVMLLEGGAPHVVPGIASRTLAERLAPYSCYATLFICGPRFQHLLEALKKRYNTITVWGHSRPESLLWSLSTVSAGDATSQAVHVVRIAGIETEIVKHWLKGTLKEIVDIIGEEVYQRVLI